MPLFYLFVHFFLLYRLLPFTARCFPKVISKMAGSVPIPSSLLTPIPYRRWCLWLCCGSGQFGAPGGCQVSQSSHRDCPAGSCSSGQVFPSMNTLTGSPSPVFPGFWASHGITLGYVFSLTGMSQWMQADEVSLTMWVMAEPLFPWEYWKLQHLSRLTA